MIKLLSCCLFLVGILVSCSRSSVPDPPNNSEVEDVIDIADQQAAVVGVTWTGDSDNYNFSVTIASPDTGCEQYADWWEVLSQDGDLIYRRILGHSHVDEQPFTRSGGAVSIASGQHIYVRAHMNNLGYGSLVYSGTIEQNLQSDTLDSNFASGLESMSPLPTDCAF